GRARVFRRASVTAASYPACMSFASSLGCALAAALIGVSGCPGAHHDPGAEDAPPARSPLPPEPRIDDPFPPKGAENTPFGARLGMDLARFSQIFPAQTYPELRVKSPDDQVAINALVHGLDGRWTYTFEGGKLKWVLFNRYIDELTQANFDRCL